MILKSQELICVGEHKVIRSGGVTCEIEPHTLDDDFIMYDIDARDCHGNEVHRRITFPYPCGDPGCFPDRKFCGKQLHVKVITQGSAVFSLN